MGSTKVTDEKLHHTLTRATPCTLPRQAYGPNPIEWAPRGKPEPVWAWVNWPHQPAQRIPARATGWNDRVVIITWDGPAGEQNTVVWRNAVSRRTC